MDFKISKDGALAFMGLSVFALFISMVFTMCSAINDTRDVLRETCKSRGLTPHDPGTGMVCIDEKTGQMFNAWILRQNDLKEGAAK